MKPTFEHEKQFLKTVEDEEDATNERKIIQSGQIENLVKEYPNIPQDFLAYLQEIGEGTFRECQFQVKAELFDLSDLGLEEHYEIKKTIKFFGDNFSGDFAGFDFENNDGCVVELWHDCGEIYYTKQTFGQYIREQMLMDENGNDMREK